MSESITQQIKLAIWLVVWDDELSLGSSPEYSGPAAMYLTEDESRAFVNGREGFKILALEVRLEDFRQGDVLRHWTGPHMVDPRTKWRIDRMFDSGWDNPEGTIWAEGFSIDACQVFPIGDESFTEFDNGEMRAEVYADTEEAALQRALDHFGCDRFTETFMETEPPARWAKTQEDIT